MENQTKKEIIRGASLIASSITEPEDYYSPLLSEHVLEAVRNVGLQLRPPRAFLFRCSLCGRDFDTKRGYFLHLIRSHREEILQLVFLEAERIVRSSKDLRF